MTSHSDVTPESDATPDSVVSPAKAGAQFLLLPDARLEYLDLPGATPSILLLHEGLGSVSMWRDFPVRLARASGRRVVAYSREGFGRSSPRKRAFTPRFMHEEALEVLPRLRDALGLDDVVLAGHSTGASMALIHAADGPVPVRGVVAMAPLVDVEARNLGSIREARIRYETTGWREKLAVHHDDVDAVFRGWNDTWLDPGFRDWNLRAELARLAVPVLAIVGEDDPYSGPTQADAIAALSPAPVTVLRLPGCGHAPHRERTAEVLAAVGAFL